MSNSFYFLNLLIVCSVLALPDANVGGGAAIGVLPALDPDSSGTSGEARDTR